MSAPRTALLVVLLAACAALTACEGTSADAKNAYVREINAAQDRFATSVTQATRLITPESSPAQDRRTFDRFQAAIVDVIGTLRAIEPPDDVEREHAQLIAALTGFADDIADARKSIRAHTTTAIAEGQRKLGAATITVNEKLRRVTEAINEKLSG